MADRRNSFLRDPSGQGRFVLPPMPFWVKAALLIFVVGSWVPLALVARARSVTSKVPQVHIFQDMDHQPRFLAQSVNTAFADRRAMRPPVEGTVAQGHLELDKTYNTGLVALKNEQGEPVTDYVKQIPDRVTVDVAFIQHGQARFNIYCAPCHGYDGGGEGIVSRRALELQEPKWIPPTSLHSDTVVERPDGHIFNTITNGIRNMPSYKSQIPVRDRWAIVAYVRALQRSQHASLEDVPEEARSTLR